MSSKWRKFFVEWPECVGPNGVVITDFEQIPFVAYMLQEHFVLLERRTPDTVGARRVLVPYSEIRSVKLCNPVKTEELAQCGFRQMTAVKA